MDDDANASRQGPAPAAAGDRESTGAGSARTHETSPTSSWGRWDWLRPRAGETDATLLAMLPWLGVPVLISAALAAAGQRLPGEVLPVVAFLPILIPAYALAMRLPPRRRVAAVGIPGFVVIAALLAYLAQSAGPGSLRTFGTAALLTLACVVAVWAVGRKTRWRTTLATSVCGAMVFSQGFDGWLTYLAVGNPFGWLPDPVEERVLVSRVLLELAPGAYPFLKAGLAIGFAVLLTRGSLRPPALFAFALVVCYAGFSPAMFSAANLFAN